MDDKDDAILLNLIAKPTASNKEISEQLNISQATISRRIKSLREKYIFKGTQLVIDRIKLGLQTFSLILLPAHPWNESMLILELFFEKYAFTAYQNRIFGKMNGLFVQISIPFGFEEVVEKLCEELEKHGIILQFEIIMQTQNRLRYPLDIKKYNTNSKSFEFSYDKMRQLFENSSHVVSLTKSTKFEEINETLLQLISEMFTRDASRSLEEIGDPLNLSKQEVSRIRIEYGLNEWDYETIYDRNKFGVFNQVLYILNRDDKVLGNLNYLLENEYPYQSVIIPSISDIILLIHLPAIDVMRFTNILQSNFVRVDFYLLSRNPRNYPPWSGNLNKDGTWNVDENRMLVAFGDEEYTKMLTIPEFSDFVKQQDRDYTIPLVESFKRAEQKEI